MQNKSLSTRYQIAFHCISLPALAFYFPINYSKAKHIQCVGLFLEMILIIQKGKENPFSFLRTCSLVLIELLRKRNLAHRRPAKAQASLRISAVSPEPLCSQTCSRDLEDASGKEKKRKKKRKKKTTKKRMPVAQIENCACAFEQETRNPWGPFFRVPAQLKLRRMQQFGR